MCFSGKKNGVLDMTGKKILVIEDDPQLQRIMVAALSKTGYEVILSGNGTEGESEIKAQRPDLVITDVMLPGKNGLDICIDLKKDPEISSIPVIMMTCLTDDSSRADDYWQKETGADDFISKPFPLTELLKRIQVLLPE